MSGILERGKSILLLGARQTGKTTLISKISSHLSLSLINPGTRQRYEKRPDLLIGEVEALKVKNPGKRLLVIIDEVQKVPDILDSVQDLIDREIAIFILTGSSARKLKRKNINLLPGRIIPLRLDPFVLDEYRSDNLDQLLLYGSLPGIVKVEGDENKEEDLDAYVKMYLEEEIRSEAIVRNVGVFARFLECAGMESGKIVNLRSISQEIGVSHVTISSYFQILEDCLIIERVEPITKSSSRKKLIKSNRYLLFDLGVRRLCAEEGVRISNDARGRLFEQFIGLELIRNARLRKNHMKIKFWRDVNGIEVDWVIEKDAEYIPIEVKLTDTPGKRDIKHLKIFLKEYSNVKYAYIVCRVHHDVQLEHNIIAIPWQNIGRLFQ